MKIQNVKIDDLRPFERNPKIHPESQLKQLEKSISEFGWTNPVLATKEGMIVAGHARVEAAKRLNLSGVPVIYLDMPYEKAIAYVVADNRLAELAETDTENLSDILNELIEIPDFDIELTGFDIGDIESLNADIEKHINMYKPGVGKLDTDLEFIEDEAAALMADDEAHKMIDDKSTILISFSGGRDSTFAMLWAKENFPDKRIIASFVDTGVEFPGVTAHVWDVCKFMDIECQIVKPDKDVWVYWAEKERFFNIIFPECQSTFIFAPLDTYYQTFDSNDVVILDGSRGDQARRTSNKTKTSGASNTKMKDYSYYHPCFNIDYDVEVAIIEKSGVPMWEGYEMGFKRSACWCCPAQSGEQAYALSQNYPGLVDVIRRWEKRLNMKFDFTNDSDIDHKIEVGRKKAERRKNTEMQA